MASEFVAMNGLVLLLVESLRAISVTSSLECDVATVSARRRRCRKCILCVTTVIINVLHDFDCVYPDHGYYVVCVCVCGVKCTSTHNSNLCDGTVRDIVIFLVKLCAIYSERTHALICVAHMIDYRFTVRLDAWHNVYIRLPLFVHSHRESWSHLADEYDWYIYT